MRRRLAGDPLLDLAARVQQLALRVSASADRAILALESRVPLGPAAARLLDAALNGGLGIEDRTEAAIVAERLRGAVR